jgi:hypothetical protein
MSDSVALNVHRATSSASVVHSMKVNITVTRVTSVRIAADIVKIILDYAVHGMMSYPYQFLILRKPQRRACWEAHVRGTGIRVMNVTF